MTTEEKKPIKCWHCSSKDVVSHPRRNELITFELYGKKRDERHSQPDNSYYCNEFKYDLVLCDRCNTTSCEWFYNLEETSDDMWVYKNKVLCQCCHYDEWVKNGSKESDLDDF